MLRIARILIDSNSYSQIVDFIYIFVKQSSIPYNPNPQKKKTPSISHKAKILRIGGLKSRLSVIVVQDENTAELAIENYDRNKNRNNDNSSY